MKEVHWNDNHLSIDFTMHPRDKSVGRKRESLFVVLLILRTAHETISGKSRNFKVYGNYKRSRLVSTWYNFEPLISGYRHC